MILTIIITAIPFASAATVLDETKKVSFTVNCSKPGYTFEVFRVADLKTTSGSTNETSYSPLFDSISSEVKAGNSKNILEALYYARTRGMKEDEQIQVGSVINMTFGLL